MNFQNDVRSVMCKSVVNSKKEKFGGVFTETAGFIMFMNRFKVLFCVKRNNLCQPVYYYLDLLKLCYAPVVWLTKFFYGYFFVI